MSEELNVTDAEGGWRVVTADDVSAMMSELASLRAELEAAKQWGTDLSNELTHRTTKLIEARRLLEEAERQEPVAFEYKGLSGEWIPCSEWAVNMAEANGRETRGLYAAAPVPAQPAADVASICTAYEDGVSHGSAPKGSVKSNPHPDGSSESNAWALGFSSTFPPAIRASTQHDKQSSVADICNAYESGVGHSGRPTAKVNPYREGSPEHEAYAIGASGTKNNAQPAAVPEAVAKVVMRDDACPHCARY